MLQFKDKSKEDVIKVMFKLWLRQAMPGLLICAAGYFILSSMQFVSLVCGVIWALLDDALILSSVVRGFGTTPERSKRILFFTFVSRLVTGVALVVAMLSIKLNVLSMLLGFILLHIFLILNLKTFTSPGD